MCALVREYEQVTDDEGRRRFHGAFTGGFSAGYYNSVGSKEGWQPSTFSSSRHARGQAVQQRAEDFMDDDDDPLLGKRLETSAQFDPLKARELQKQQQQQLALASTVTAPRNAFEARVLSAPPRSAAASSASSLNLLDALVRPVNDSMGAKLLNRMGWKEGHGIGPRVRRKRIEEPGASAAAADDDGDEADVVSVPPRNTVDVASFPTPKLDVYGAGFDPYVSAPEFAQYKQRRAVAAKTESSQPTRVTFADAMRAPAGRYDSVTGFGLSALEENDDLDVYGTAAMSEFDTELGGPKRLTNGSEVKRLDSQARESYGRAPSVGSDGRPALPGFEYAVKKDSAPKAVALRLHVPADFTPKHTFDDDVTAHRGDATALLYQQHNFSTEAHGRGAVMTAKQRAVLLGESPAPPSPPQQERSATSGDSTTPSSASVFDLLNPEQRTKLFAQANALKTMRANGSAPAASDDQLVAPPRARQPLVQGVAGSQFVANITASIAKRFVSATASDEPNDSASTAAAAAPVAKKTSHRSESVWIPNSLLCKRFRVKCVAGVASQQQQESDAKRDLFDKELVPHLVEFAAERRSASARANDATEATDCAVAGANGKQRPTRFGPRLSDAPLQEQMQVDDASDVLPLPSVAKPAPSLLKAIFEPSDESEEDDDDDEDASDNDQERKSDAEQERNDTRQPNSAFRSTSARDCADASSSDESESGADNREQPTVETTAGARESTRKEKRHKSSKKKKDKKKHKKHKRSSRYSDSDDSDRAHRSKRKKSASRKRSRSASRERLLSKRASRRH